MKIDFALNFKKTRKELKYLFLGATQKLNYLLNYWAEGLAKALAITNSKGGISFGIPPGGMNVDNETLVYNPLKASIGVDYAAMLTSIPPPTTINFSQSSVTISTDSTLNGDVFATDFTIDSGVTLTTNGHSIICSGTFTNNGTIVTGYAPSGINFPNSYGGSGGGGNNDGGNYPEDNGYSTIASGGTQGEPGTNGSTPSTPTLTNSTINTWFTNGFSNYLSGASGGGSFLYNESVGDPGGNGIYIQANEIIAGAINSSGSSATINGYPAAGGGGGVILLAYGSGGYTTGTYTISGGSGGGSGTAAVGSGGDGQALSYSYGATVPISTQQYSVPASTSNYAIISLTHTSQYGKPIKVVFSGTTTASFGNMYIQNAQTGTIIGMSSNIYPDFSIEAVLPFSTSGQQYTFTLYATNTTTASVDLTIYNGYAIETSLG